MNGRTWKWALVGSLVLNAFLLGGIAGGAYQWYWTYQGRHPRLTQSAGLRFAADDLSPDRRRQFAEELQAARRAGRSLARQSREGRRDVLGLLSAPKFDRAALEAALARTRQTDSALRAQIEGGIVDFVATLSPEERITFARALERRRRWHTAVNAEPRQERRALRNEATRGNQTAGATAPDTKPEGESK